MYEGKANEQAIYLFVGIDGYLIGITGELEDTVAATRYIAGKNLNNAEVECVSKMDIKIPIENIQISDDMIVYETDLADTTAQIDFIVANFYAT